MTPNGKRWIDKSVMRAGEMILILVLLVGASVCPAEDWPQFRGPRRNGVSGETGLLERWPEGGPEMIWSTKGLGTGFASVSVVDGVIYTTGMVDKTGYLFAIGADGRQKWRRAYGPEWAGSHPGTRTTPSVDGNRLYIMSGQGRIACHNTADGQPIWKVDTLEDFDGKNVQWGIAESVLIDGDRVFCTPGGENATMVALNKHTGQTVWTTKGLSNLSAYCSPILYKTPKKGLLMTMVRGLIICVDSANGEVLWTIPHETRNNIAAVTPVRYCQGRTFFTSHGTGGSMVRCNADGANPEILWTSPAMDCLHGGVVLHAGGYGLCGSDSKGNWVSQKILDGTVISSEKLLDAKGSLIAADRLLYCYSEKGQLGLIRSERDGLKLISSFRIKQGSGQHWAHPAISDGVLYIRHGEVLMAFDIRAG